MREPLLEIRTDRGAEAVEALKALPGVVEAGMFGRAVHAAVSDVVAVRAAIPGALASRGLALQGIAEVQPSLEDVFISLVRAGGGAVDD
jgi:ABC-2 type transport system ATP-binding protein